MTIPLPRMPDDFFAAMPDWEYETLLCSCAEAFAACARECGDKTFSVAAGEGREAAVQRITMACMQVLARHGREASAKANFIDFTSETHNHRHAPGAALDRPVSDQPDAAATVLRRAYRKLGGKGETHDFSQFLQQQLG